MESLLYPHNWKLVQPESSLTKKIRGELGCSTPFAKVLASRYGNDFNNFQNGQSAALHSPDSLPDISPAVERIEAALKNEERIFIHGDFDTDGLSSAAIMYKGLKSFDKLMQPGSLKVEVGNREGGHGLDSETSSRLINEEFDLLITTDCGITAGGEIEYLQQFGIDVIVTDHHEPPEQIPPAVAVVDPKRPDSKYKNPNLSGSGVAYKLLLALGEKLEYPVPSRNNLVQLAMLGTVADLSPLISDGEDENKRLVAQGLEKLSNNPSPGLYALMEESNLKADSINTKDISYRLAPKLNAANRVGDPKVGFLLLITENLERARYLAKVLSDYDKDRSILQGRITRHAHKLLQKGDTDPREEGLVFINGEDWNPGILGLVASKLTQEYNVPSAVTTIRGNQCRGSIRSIKGINIVDGLDYCSEYLDKFGGHEMAGGFKLGKHHICDFRNRLSHWCKQRLKDLGTAPAEKKLEAELKPEQITLDLVEEIGKLSPFGVGNPEPKFMIKEAEVTNLRKVGKNRNHLKMELPSHHATFDCIGFSLGEALEELPENSPLNLAFKLERDTWSGTGVQLVLEDFLL